MNNYFINGGWVWDGVKGAADRVMSYKVGSRYVPTNPTRRHTEAALAGVVILRDEGDKVWIRNLSGQARERSVKLASFVHDYCLAEEKP
jgi:hypothetical protein